jgi:hypothetical protein
MIRLSRQMADPRHGSSRPLFPFKPEFGPGPGLFRVVRRAPALQKPERAGHVVFAASGPCAYPSPTLTHWHSSHDLCGLIPAPACSTHSAWRRPRPGPGLRRAAAFGPHPTPHGSVTPAAGRRSGAPARAAGRLVTVWPSASLAARSPRRVRPLPGLTLSDVPRPAPFSRLGPGPVPCAVTCPLREAFDASRPL